MEYLTGPQLLLKSQKLLSTESMLTWFCHFRNIHSLLICHETQNRENGKAGNNAGGTVQQTQVETISERKKKKRNTMSDFVAVGKVTV